MLLSKTVQFDSEQLEKLEKLADKKEGGNFSRLMRKITDAILKKET